ncbi:hypothetical protein [Malonomonas rubra]|nr:hypothetical protein [Malonomonas rubra]
MQKITNIRRTKRLILEAIEKLDLDLSGIKVLTEAASGSFAVTPLIAALANAQQVVAVGRDSRFGEFSKVKSHIEYLAREFGVEGQIRFSENIPQAHAAQAELVTNLGFLRPIDRDFVSLLPDNAAISLMWETWEFREDDIDLSACAERGVPVLGTCETDPRLQIFKYVGLLALKLLFEMNIEVFRSRILVVGGGPFGKEICGVLKDVGAIVLHWSPDICWQDVLGFKEFVDSCDALVLAEHHHKHKLLGGEFGLPLEWFRGQEVPLAHICGDFDAELLDHGVTKHPKKKVSPGYMTVTTDYVGLRPIVDLHTAGLKVGSELVCGMRKFGDTDRAIKHALENSPAMDWE